MDYFDEAGEIPKEIWGERLPEYVVVRPGVPNVGCIHNSIIVRDKEKTCAWCGQVWAMKSFSNKSRKKLD